MKRIAQFFFGLKPILLYTLGLYTVAIFFNVFVVHGQELSCKEYLHICETSCVLRGEMVQFACLGANINPGSDRYRCLCGDEAFRVTRQTARPTGPDPVFFEKRQSLGSPSDVVNSASISESSTGVPVHSSTSRKVSGSTVEANTKNYKQSR